MIRVYIFVKYGDRTKLTLNWSFSSRLAKSNKPANDLHSIGVLIRIKVQRFHDSSTCLNALLDPADSITVTYINLTRQ